MRGCTGLASEQVQRLLSTFQDYPPRQKSFDINIDELMHQLNPARSR